MKHLSDFLSLLVCLDFQCYVQSTDIHPIDKFLHHFCCVDVEESNFFCIKNDAAEPTF